MPTTTFPPILVWQPGGGTPVGPVSNPPVYSQSDITQLVIGQAYVDVVFGSVQTDNNWVLVTCEVENTIDLDPLNIWPGIITNRTPAGFRLQLNGMPDSGNYYLHWAVSGVNITPGPASTYLFTGPTSAPFGVNEPFTVKLPPSTTLAAPITITPNDGGAGGTFSPPTVTLSNGSAIATFSYNAVAYGAATISVTNSGTLTDPASIVFTSTAPTYTFTGPTGGVGGVPSTNFTVNIGGQTLAMATTITPHDAGGGGTFTPTTVVLNTGSPPQHFTYTPASAGAKTISVTNSGGLADPPSLTYTATTPFSPLDIPGCSLWLKADSLALTDGAAVAAWNDSSGIGYNMTATGTARPTFKTGIVNGKPVVRFNGTTNVLNNLVSIGGVQPYTVIVVVNRTPGANAAYLFKGSTSLIVMADTYFAISAGATLQETTVDYSGVFHIFTSIFNSGTGSVYVDGTIALGPAACGTNFFDAIRLMHDGSTTFGAGDMCEIIVYDALLGTTDRTNVENYLKGKYAIP